MHGHPLVARLDLSEIGVAEHHGRVVGVVHPEDQPALCYLQVHPETAAVKEALVDWSLEHLGGSVDAIPGEINGVWVSDPDPGLEAILADRGFAPTRFHESMAMLSLHDAVPDPVVPPGYRLTTLVEDDDPIKVNRVLWRGFDHPGPPPDEEVPGRIRAQQTPHFRKDLNVVVVDEGDDFVAYAGMWLDRVNRVAYVEPVATDPDHRRRGLATAAVTEGLRRVRAEGAIVAWVGSSHPLYTALGFRVTCTNTLWTRPR